MLRAGSGRLPAGEEAGEHGDVCEVFLFDQEKVARLRPEIQALPDMAGPFKALGDETRCKIVYCLSRAELCVCDLASILGLSLPAVSYHLRVLRHHRLVRYRKEGRLVFYSLADDHVAALVDQALAHGREEGGHE